MCGRETVVAVAGGSPVGEVAGEKIFRIVTAAVVVVVADVIVVASGAVVVRLWLLLSLWLT